MLIASKYEEIWAPEVSRQQCAVSPALWHHTVGVGAGVVDCTINCLFALHAKPWCHPQPLAPPSPLQPQVRDFVYISDKAYSREDILACEKKMLEVRAGRAHFALRGLALGNQVGGNLVPSLPVPPVLSN